MVAWLATTTWGALVAQWIGSYPCHRTASRVAAEASNRGLNRQTQQRREGEVAVAGLAGDGHVPVVEAGAEADRRGRERLGPELPQH
jgi:hypothetical protein